MAAPQRRAFGKIKQMRSGRFQASYVVDAARYTAPTTFDTKRDADAFLAAVQTDLGRGVWKPPVSAITAIVTNVTVGEYMPVFLATQLTRKGQPITDRTREEYRRLFVTLVQHTLASRQLDEVTRHDIDRWYAKLNAGTPAQRANAYTAIKALFNSAIKREVIPGPNPCQIQGGGSKTRETVTTVASDEELTQVFASLPPKYRVMALLCSWLGLRMGEVIELRRKDIDFGRGLIRIHRGATHTTAGGCTIQATKGKRKSDMPLLAHLVEPLHWHLDRYAEPGREGRLFVPALGGCHLKPSTIYGSFYPAREAIHRPDLRFHDLRHTALVRFAEAGATGAELMEFGRHATASASERYQSVANGRMSLLASKLTERAGSNVISLDAKRIARGAAETA